MVILMIIVMIILLIAGGVALLAVTGMLLAGAYLVVMFVWQAVRALFSKNKKTLK